MSSRRLARSAGLIGVATMTSRVLAVGRETVIAALFGAGDAMDAYNVAFRVPNLLRDLFAEGAISAAFIPTFTRTLTGGGRAAAWRLGNLVTSTLFVITVACVVVAFAGIALTAIVLSGLLVGILVLVIAGETLTRSGAPRPA